MQFTIIFVGRIVAVFSTFYLFRLCCATRTINFNELCFITYAGVIRGAIAFALVLKIPYINSADPAASPSCPEAATDPTTKTCFTEPAYRTMVSTTLILVMMTTLIFGTFMGKVQKMLVPATVEDKEEYL